MMGRCDFVSRCGGMPQWKIRVFADDIIQDAIILAAGAFESRLSTAMRKYETAIVGLPATERRVYEDILV